MVSVAWARRKEWAQRNPEEYRAQKRKWYENNRERIQAKNKAISPQRVEANRKYYKKHPEKLVARWLNCTYRMTMDEYRAMSARQNGRCAICQLPEAETRQRKFHIDHCHATGAIRGLLCEHCNRMLGLAKDRQSVLIAGAAYLKKTGGNHS